jgi:hypothetical protein
LLILKYILTKLNSNLILIWISLALNAVVYGSKNYLFFAIQVFCFIAKDCFSTGWRIAMTFFFSCAQRFLLLWKVYCIALIAVLSKAIKQIFHIFQSAFFNSKATFLSIGKVKSSSLSSFKDIQRKLCAPSINAAKSNAFSEIEKFIADLSCTT